jgi:hypothetical protein
MSRLPALLGATLLALTTLSGVAPATASPAADRPDRPPADSAAASPGTAQEALARAEALFSGGAAERAGSGQSAHAHGRDGTLVLRDLALAREQLRGEERRRADALLARPTDGRDDPFGDGYTTTAVERACGPAVCVHWVEATADAVPLGDANGNGRPDYVDRTLAALNHVHATYRRAGYRAPEGDGGLGGDDRTDVYLVDIGYQGLYGYCDTDEAPHTDYTTWAYCVLDDDYSRAQFPTNTPVENMRVTAAHEYFHAVQFGYDYFEDRWLLESTATWAEDEVYDSVDDSAYYLRSASPLTRPHIPLDTYDNTGHQYGTWIFFRYLTERMPSSDGGMPTLVRDIWRRADGRAGAPDDYSIQAVRRVLAQRKADWTATFTRFAESGRRSRQVYDEGQAQRYPVTPLWKKVTLTPSNRSSVWFERPLNHLTSATARFTPGRTMTHRRWRLRLQVDMAPRARGSAALVTVHPRKGKASTRLVRLDRRGDDSLRVPFSRRRVEAVEVTLVNTSTRYEECWTGSPYACSGWSKDDFLFEKVRAVASR